MFDSTSEMSSFPPNSSELDPQVVKSILWAASKAGLIGELSDRAASLYFCERGVREWIDSGSPFTATMVANRMPVEQSRGHMGLVIGWLAQARLIERVGAVFSGYPLDDSGRPTCLWVAKS